MSEKIEPALTPEDWATGRVERFVNDAACTVEARVGHAVLKYVYTGDGGGTGIDRVYFDECIPAVIALANAALPDDDPHKITREVVALLRKPWHTDDCGALYALYDHECKCDAHPDVAGLLRLAAVLDSYLPPEAQ